MSDNKESMKETTDVEVEKEKGETKKEVLKKIPNVSPSSTTAVTVKLTQAELQTLDYSDFSTPARMLALGEVLCKSQLVPLKTPQDVMTALLTGKELGLPFITSMSNIYPINGRPTIGVHIQKALLLKAGIVFEKIEDAVVIYSFVKKEGDKLVEVHRGILAEQPEGSKKKAVDTRTTYSFNREIKRPSGKFREITAKGSFTISEATDAGLIEKDVWVKYWRRMLDARAFTNGAREIADDVLLGLYSHNELSDNYYINEAGEEVHTAEIVED